MNRIPLAERFSRIKDGKLSDPTIQDGLLESVVQMPMRIYLGNYRMDDFAKYLGYGENTREAGALTYGEAVAQIHTMWSFPDFRPAAIEAMWILMKPYYIEYKRRKIHAANQPR